MLVMMDTARDRTLDMLPPGAVASVVRVAGEDPIARRLSDLGFWPGTLVQVVRRAPLGDPVQYALRGYRLALRRAEAGRVLVRPAAGPAEEIDP
jgi:ferrous iron transport protein A